MTVLVLDCPHCGADHTSFNVVAAHARSNYQLNVMAECGRCCRPVSAVLHIDLRLTRYEADQMQHRLLQEKGDLCNWGAVRILEGPWPVRPAVLAPLHTPDLVAQAWVQAEKSRRAQLWDAACAMYRRCMEIALKEFAPEVQAWKLEKRIDKLASENRITPALKEWAHELRLDGNEALHAQAPATQELAEQMHGLCHFLLIYLYTLPEQVRQARATREGEPQ